MKKQTILTSMVLVSLAILSTACEKEILNSEPEVSAVYELWSGETATSTTGYSMTIEKRADGSAVVNARYSGELGFVPGSGIQNPEDIDFGMDGQKSSEPASLLHAQGTVHASSHTGIWAVPFDQSEVPFEIAVPETLPSPGTPDVCFCRSLIKPMVRCNPDCTPSVAGCGSCIVVRIAEVKSFGSNPTARLSSGHGYAIVKATKLFYNGVLYKSAPPVTAGPGKGQPSN